MNPLTSTIAGILVVQGLIVGAKLEGTWYQASEEEASFDGKTFYAVGVGKILGTQKGLTTYIQGISGMRFATPKKSSYKVLWSGEKPTFPSKVTSTKKKVLPEITALVTEKLAEAPTNARSSNYRVVAAYVGDLDLDGKMDRIEQIESKVSYESPIETKWNAVVLTRGGKAPEFVTFHTAVAIEEYETTDISAIADFDRDGKFDLVLTTWYHEGQSGSMHTIEKDSLVQVISRGS